MSVLWFVLGFLLGVVSLHVLIGVLLRLRKRAAAKARVVIQNPCNLIDESDPLWWILGCWWENV